MDALRDFQGMTALSFVVFFSPRESARRNREVDLIRPKGGYRQLQCQGSVQICTALKKQLYVRRFLYHSEPLRQTRKKRDTNANQTSEGIQPDNVYARVEHGKRLGRWPTKEIWRNKYYGMAPKLGL